MKKKTAESRFDELHDQFDPFRTTKAGTRYERLTAIVLKVLREHDTVIHDIKLIGESEVKHQIDVTVETAGKPKRLLVECKDFDVSGDPVGLSILRNFFGVVEDTKPDEAFVITCSDFTKDARVYAKAKGIRLAVLRTPDEYDWRRSPRAIQGTIILRVPTLVGCKFNFLGEESIVGPKFAADRAAAGLHPTVQCYDDPVYFNGTEDGRVQVNDYLSKHMNACAKDIDDEGEATIPLHGVTMEIEDRGGHPLLSMTLKIKIEKSEPSFINVTADAIAALILDPGSDSEAVVWEHDLRRFVIDSDGFVRERMSGRVATPLTEGDG